jgi:hypothetical protein
VRRTFFSPAGFLLTAALIAALYGLGHLAGLRESTTLLSGTSPPGGAAGAALGLCYIALHFAFVVLAPILALGAAVLWALSRRYDH